MSINYYLLKYIYLVCYLKLPFYCLTCSVIHIVFVQRFLKTEMLLEFQNKTNIEFFGFELTIWIHLRFFRYRFAKHRFARYICSNKSIFHKSVDTLYLLDTDIPIFCLQDVLKMSSKHVFRTSSRHVFKTSSGHVFKTSSTHVCKTSSRHVFWMSSRRL